MNWRDRYYATYISQRFVPGGRTGSLESLRSHFPIWSSYYGAHLPKDKGAAILDVGCGNGELVYWLREQGYKNVSGVDGSKEQVDESKRLGIAGIIHEDFRSFLKGKEETYDCIIARDFVEHFDKDEVFDMLSLLNSSLRSGGMILIQTPNAESPFGSRYRYADITHGLSFTHHSLNHALQACGFCDGAFFPMRPVAHGIPSFIRYVSWRCIEFMLRAYLLIENGSTSGAILTQNMIAVALK
jgi:2-polyprenyl-3-methyl-5-hydroxy-6-metoxy-1,4-benzoquinol methylase